MRTAGFLVTLLFLVTGVGATSAFAQQGSRTSVHATTFAPRTGGDIGVDEVSLILDLAEYAYEGGKWLYLRIKGDDGVERPLTEQEIASISAIETEVDNTLDISAAYLIYKIVRGDAGSILKKIVAWEKRLLEAALPNSFAIAQMDQGIPYDFTTTTYVNGVPYVVNVRMTVLRTSVAGDFLIFSGFSLSPEAFDPLNISLSSTPIKFYVTFSSPSGDDIVKYPGIKTFWSTLNGGPILVYELPPGVYEELYVKAPVLTMGVFHKNFWGKETLVQLAQFVGGRTDIVAIRPVVVITEEDFALNLTWLPDANTQKYLVFRSEQAGIDTNRVNVVAEVISTAFRDEAVTPGHRYYYRVMPILASGKEGPMSPEVSGTPQAVYNITLAEPDAQNYRKGSQFSLTGVVTSVNTGSTPVGSPEVDMSIEEFGYEFERTIGTINGHFGLLAEVPIVPGTYTYKVRAGKDGVSSSRMVVRVADELPEHGMDLAVDSIAVGERAKTAGQTFSAGIWYSNKGKVQVAESLCVELWKDNGEMVHRQTVFVTIPGFSAGTTTTSITVPTALTSGYYTVVARLPRTLDEDWLNNSKSAVIHVSMLTDPPAYRLSEITFDTLNALRTVDGIQVRLSGIGAGSARFDVAGASTDFLDEDDLWMASTQTFMMIVTQVVSDSGPVRVRAGINRTGYNHTPYHAAAFGQVDKEVNVVAPSGSVLALDPLFVGQDDATIMNGWLQYAVTGTSANRITTAFRFPSVVTRRTYSAYLRVRDTGQNYWWVKRLYLTPLKVFGAESDGSLQLSNGFPDNKTGDRYTVRASYRNTGEIAHELPVLLVVRNDTGIVWRQNNTLDLGVGATATAEFEFPTLGLSEGSYTLESRCASGERDTPNDNLVQGTVLLNDILPLTVTFEPMQSVYTVGDSAIVAVSVRSEAADIPDAAVTLTTLSPDGVTTERVMAYHATDHTYQTSLRINIGGNYRLSVSAAKRRYEQGNATNILKSLVELSIRKDPGKAVKGQGLGVRIAVSPVGGAYAFACDMTHGTQLIFDRAEELQLINQGGSAQTSFQCSPSAGRVVLGITRLDPSAFPGASWAETDVARIGLFITGTGASTLDLENVGLIDYQGEPMAVLVHDLSTVLKADTTVLKVNTVDTTKQVGDTIAVVTSAFRIQNLAGVSFTLDYDPTTVRYLGTTFDQALGEYGQVSLSSQAADDGRGLVTMGSIRLGSDVPGLTTSVAKIATSQFCITQAGESLFGIHDLHLYSPMPGVEYPSMVVTDTANALAGSSGIARFDPPAMELAQDSTAVISLVVDSIANVFSCVGEFRYNPGIVRIQGVSEGTFLRSDGIATSFLYSLDTLAGRVTFGITRLGGEHGPVGTSQLRSVISLEVKRIGGDSTAVSASTMDFLDILGAVVPVRLDSLAVVLDPAQGVVSITCLYNTGWNLVSVPLIVQDSSVAALLPRIVSEAYAFDRGYEGVAALNHGGGYWAKFGGHDSLVATGTPVLPRSISVKAGWNMIGSFELPVSVATLSSSPASIVRSPFYEFREGYHESSTLVPGTGYWVKSAEAGILTFTQGTPKVPSVREASDSSALVFTFVDGSGSERRVMLCTRDRMPINVELPPVPPQGTLDVRFTNQSAYDTLENARHELLLTSVLPPLTVRGTNVMGKAYALSYKVGTAVHPLSASGENEWSIPHACDRMELNEVLDGTNGVPVFYALHQNYPNPFNPTSRIRYALPERTRVTLSVYDLLGRKVKLLVDREEGAGYHEVTFDASDMASGVYLYRLRAGSFVDVKKLVFMK